MPGVKYIKSVPGDGEATRSTDKMNVINASGEYLTQGLQDSSVCDEGKIAAQSLANQLGETVYLCEDDCAEDDLFDNAFEPS